MICDLTWDNYLDLNKIIKTNNYETEYFTPIGLVQWLFYGFKFKFHKTDDFIIMYLWHNNYQKIDNKWSVFASYYKKDFNLNKLKQIIKEDLIQLNGNDELNFVDLLEKTINDWQLNDYHKYPSTYISNYLYNIDQMRTFNGKKMQKKRNHLNAFLKQNYNLEIKKFQDVPVNDILTFCDNHIKKYSSKYREYEFNIYQQYLINESVKDLNYIGTVILINHQIVAFTFGYVNGNTFEIIIEKAEKEIRGLYQYLIMMNLKTHELNDVLYIDREDDAGIYELAKSKRSYHPFLMVQRWCLKNIKNWFND